MEPAEAIIVLEKIIDASISDITIQNELKESLHKVYKDRQVIAARGILSDCHIFGDKEISQEIGDLIKDVIFYYG